MLVCGGSEWMCMCMYVHVSVGVFHCMMLFLLCLIPQDVMFYNTLELQLHSFDSDNTMMMMIIMKMMVLKMDKDKLK